MFIAPFVFLLLTSLMTSQQALTATYGRTRWHSDNYVEVFQQGAAPPYLVNTLLYSGPSTVVHAPVQRPGGVRPGRSRAGGADGASCSSSAMMMLPPQVTDGAALPDVGASCDLTGTLWPLILPILFGDAFSIFLLRQFFLTIPQEYLDAARVDGCGEWRDPAAGRAADGQARASPPPALFQFFYAWNDYYGPLLYTSENASNWTLSLGLASFRALHHVQWNLDDGRDAARHAARRRAVLLRPEARSSRVSR